MPTLPISGEPDRINNVVEFTGDYKQPPFMESHGILGCADETCGAFTFLIRTNGEIVCASCGTVAESKAEVVN